MKKTLIVMAAGMGSRFGGLKQLEGFGPGGEVLLEYSAYDAARAGFDAIVFVIRKHMEADFQKSVLPRIEKHIPATLVFQELESHFPIPVPASRGKPWGTGHAVLVARESVSGPFAVINADDFYGVEAFDLMSDFLGRYANVPESDATVKAALVVYELKNTLSENGAVSRGVCQRTKSGPFKSDGSLEGIVEHTHIERKGEAIVSSQEGGVDVVLAPDTLVSMNFWGFSHNFFPQLEAQFHAFLKTSANDPKAEFYLPFAVDALIKEGKTHPTVLPCHSDWLGVTYPGDAAHVRSYLAGITGGGKLYAF